MPRSRILLIGTVAALVVLVTVLAVTLVVRGRLEARVADRLACRLGDRVDVSMSAWRTLTALGTGELGDVRVRAEDVDDLGADLEVDLQDVRREEGGVSYSAARARVDLPLDGLGVPLTADDGQLVASREVLGTRIQVALAPRLSGTELDLEVTSVLLGDRALSGRVAEQLAGRLPTVDLTDRLPAGMTPTDVEVTADGLVLDATLDPGLGAGAGTC